MWSRFLANALQERAHTNQLDLQKNLKEGRCLIFKPSIVPSPSWHPGRLPTLLIPCLAIFHVFHSLYWRVTDYPKPSMGKANNYGKNLNGGNALWEQFCKLTFLQKEENYPVLAKPDSFPKGSITHGVWPEKKSPSTSENQ